MAKNFSTIPFCMAYHFNRLFCHLMYQTKPSMYPALPAGPVLLTADHHSYSDPLVLSATTGRPITFLMAREIYFHTWLRWLFKLLPNAIPINRGRVDVKALRNLLFALAMGEVVGIFPQGGIDEYRRETGYLGVGYLALKTGVPVVPVAIFWSDTRPLSLLASLITPAQVSIRYGNPIIFDVESHPTRERILEVTSIIMDSIRQLHTC